MSAVINLVIRQAQAENAEWQKRHRLYLFVLGLALAAWVLYSVVTLHSRSVPFPLLHGGLLLIAAIFGQEGLGLLSRPTRQHRRAIHALTEGNGPAFVGPLLESILPAWIAGGHLFRADKELYFAVNAALTRLLPQLTETDYRTLNRREMKALYVMLASDYTEVALPAIEVVTRLGDTHAVRVLEKVARRRRSTDSAALLRNAARESLRVLQGSTD